MEGLIKKEVLSNKIIILPHSIDVDKFFVNNSETGFFDCIFIGDFIQ